MLAAVEDLTCRGEFPAMQLTSIKTQEDAKSFGLGSDGPYASAASYVALSVVAMVAVSLKECPKVVVDCLAAIPVSAGPGTSSKSGVARMVTCVLAKVQFFQKQAKVECFP